MSQDNFDDIEINLSEPEYTQAENTKETGAEMPPKQEKHVNCACHGHREKPNCSQYMNGPMGCALGGLTGCVIIPVIVFVIMCISIGVACKNCGNDAGIKSAEDYIAVVRVEGVMTTGSVDAGLFGGSGVAGSDTISKSIRKAADDKKAKGIVLRVNSPGGTPVAAEEIGEAIEYAKSKKPVYTSMADSACSAAYWISSCTNKIYANRTTMTGSIGVIMNGMDFSKLLEKVGVSSQTIKSGKFKDIGSGQRPMTAEEKQLLQNLIDDTYDAFLDTVAKGRKMSKDNVKALADGRVYTGTQALNKHLVDKIGTYDACIADMAKSVNMKKTVVKEMGRNSFMDQLMAPDLKKTLDLYLINELKKSALDTQLEMR